MMKRAALAAPLVLACLVWSASATVAGPDAPDHGAGICLLASDVGNDFAVEDLVAFVETARIRDVIVDWAWITAHWDRTDFDAVSDLVRKLERRSVRVAAMYRPRFFATESGKYDVAHQVDENGDPHRGFCEIRYSDPAARRWGAQWAVRILTRCPDFDEVVIYNPTQTGKSREVIEGREKDPDFDHRCVRTFLEETRAATRKVRKKARLGLVLPPDPAHYRHYAEVVDVPRPFVFVREGADFAADRDRALEVANHGPALAKIQWGEKERISDERLGEFIRNAREKELRYVFWTFWKTFCSGDSDLGLLCRALGIDAKKIRPIIRNLGGVSGLRWEPAVVRKAVRAAADDASDQAYVRVRNVAARYGEDAVAPLCALVDDRSETDHVRWRAAGALGRTGSTKALPCLLKHSRDPSEMVRWMCAESLGFCGGGSAKAWRRLEEMAETDPANRPGPADGPSVWFVRDTARKSLDRLKDHPSRVWKGVAVVAVKDFMRIENSGAAVEGLSFPRYSPAIDREQIVVGRWVQARTDDGKPVTIALTGVAPDPGGNLLHTWRVECLPAKTGVVVTITSLVLRRERPPPKGRYRIRKPSDYPEAVRPYLRSTAAVEVDHPEVRAVARRILAKTKDAWEVALAVARMMEGKTYRQQGNPDTSLPAAVLTLRYGGTCCRSAVAAVAVLRACGIPAQITYCPAGYIHGITRFHLEGYGWCRMDSTCGTGRLPLIQERSHRGLVRLYDMPIEMEKLPNKWSWPYHNSTIDGPYRFLGGGEVVARVRFAAHDQAEAWREKRPSGRVAEPFPHLEPGTWNEVLAVEDWEILDRKWTALASASRTAARAGQLGEFREVLKVLRRYGGESWFPTRRARLAEFGEL